ncbi:hypothetical protein [Desulfovirgula thermocuniculi]|uniref:hypothetical protein n=1 Tax=Desulfovirgula thermocuniculi TaxID=348842 RepID=UPI00041F5AE6|nr:hypothetical protein [Desulfovirgula thermocuniculi]
MLRPLVLLKSKLVAPRPGEGIWLKPSLKGRLERLIEYPLTIVCASAGYGKTTAVVKMLSDLRIPFAWFSPGPEDASAFALGWYLAGALESLVPGIAEQFSGMLAGRQNVAKETILELLLSCLEEKGRVGEGVLVIDDWHTVASSEEARWFFDHFLAGKPSWLKTVILSREKVSLAYVCRELVRGNALNIGEKHLALSREEVGEYLDYSGNVPLVKYADLIYGYSEGWIMAVKLLVKGLREGAISLPLRGLEDTVAGLSELFEFLSLDVLERQEPEVKTFLLQSSVLEFLSVPACNALMGASFSPELLQKVYERGLFLVELEGGLYRYHNLFREFLRREGQKRIPNWESLHYRAGSYCLQEGRLEESLQHFLQARQWADAAKVLSRMSYELVYSGRGQQLRLYLEKLPAELRREADFLLALGLSLTPKL